MGPSIDLNETDAAIARGILGWQTLADATGNDSEWARSIWIDPESGIKTLPSFETSMEANWAMLQVIRNRGHEEKFMAVMEEVAKEEGCKYNPAFPLFYCDAKLLCMTAVKLYGLG